MNGKKRIRTAQVRSAGNEKIDIPGSDMASFWCRNIFRALPAALHQTLLDNGLCNSGIIVCEAFDEEIIRKIYDPYDNLSVVVSIKSGTMQRKS